MDVLVVRYFDAAIGAICLLIVGLRYRGSTVRIIAGDLVLWAFAVLFVTPLFLDASDFVSSYHIYPTLGVVANDPMAQFVTAITVLIGTVVLAGTIRAEASRAVATARTRQLSRWPWLALCFLPIAVVLGAPQPGVYLHFAAEISQRGIGEPFAAYSGFVSPVAKYQVYVTWATYISTIGLTMWLLARRRMSDFLIVVPVGLIDFWLAGKRNIAAIIVIELVYVLVANRPLTRRGFRRRIACAAVLLGLLLGFSQWFQESYRPYVGSTGESAEAFKIDFGRTDVLRLAVAGQLGYVRRPLSAPGESLELYADAILGRLVGQRHAISYQDRVTSIAFERPIGPQQGSITTSLISECIDNFGWLGIAIGPLILALLLRWSSRSRDPVVGVLVALSAALLLATEALAVLPLFLFVVVRILWPRSAGRGVRTRRRTQPRIRRSEVGEKTGMRTSLRKAEVG